MKNLKIAKTEINFRRAWLMMMALLLLIPLQPAVIARSTTEDSSPWEIHVLRSDKNGLLLELSTPSYRIEPVDIGGMSYDVLRLDGVSYTVQPGAPQVPQVNALIGVPPGADISLRIHSAEAVPLAGNFHLPPVPNPAPLEGEFQPGELEYLPNPEAFASISPYPEVAARVGDDAWQRDRRIARIELFPFQYLPAQELLYWRQKILVEVLFEGDPSGEFLSSLNNSPDSGDNPFEDLLEGALINEDVAQNWRGIPREVITNGEAISRPAVMTGPAYRIPVSQDGFYKLSYKELKLAGLDVDNLNPNSFHLTSQGQEVAAYLSGNGDDNFESGEYLAFYGQKFYGDRLAELYQAEDDHWLTYVTQDISGAYKTWTPQMNAASLEKYTDENVYWLTLEQTPGLRMGIVDGFGTAPTPSTYQATVRAEEAVYYISTLFNSDETWYWDFISTNSTATITKTIKLTAVASGSYSATLNGAIVATTNSDSGSPDHHTTIYLNDPALTSPVDERFWDGKSRYEFSTQIPQSQLSEGVNQFNLVVSSTAALASQRMYFDGFEITYQRNFQAVDDQLTFTPDQAGTWKYQIGGYATGYSSTDLGVLDITNPLTPTWVMNAFMNGNTLSFKVTHGSGARFYAGKFNEIPASQITFYDPPDLSQAAEYLVISHSDFLAPAQRLADYRQSQGLLARVINVQDLYNQFNYGILNPLAIKNFLKYTLDHWSSPPVYAVLVGDGTWNFKGSTRYNSLPISMPPYLAWVDPWNGEVDSANLLAAVVGNDILADLFISRIPVNTSSELDAVVDKIISYEAAPRQDWQRNLLFIADDIPDSAGDFVAFSENIIADYVDPGYTAQRIYENDFGCSSPVPPSPNSCDEVTHAITQTLNITGTHFMNYIGHSRINGWSGESIFLPSDISWLTNSDRLPVVLSMTCLDGYWIHPGLTIPPNQDLQSLMENMLRKPQAGMVASFSPTGFGVTTGHDWLHRGFYEALLRQGVWNLGQAAEIAKLNLYATYSNLDLIHTFTIFGDPALHILSPYSMEFSPAEQSDSGPPGSTIKYTFQVTNTSSITDTIGFDLAGNLWQTSTPQSVTLPAGGVHPVTVTLSIPPDALDAQMDTFTLRAISQGDTSQISQAQVTTTAYDYGVLLSADSLQLAAVAGETVTYTVQVRNNGAYEDHYDLELGGNTWSTTLEMTTTALLQPGESTYVKVWVQVPETAQLGEFDQVMVTASSNERPARSDAVTLTTRIPLYRLFLPDIEN